MEQFRAILRSALNHAPASLWLESGTPPRVETDGADRELDGFGPVSSEAMQDLFVALFSDFSLADEHEGSEPAQFQSHIQLKEWGSLPVIGVRGDKLVLELIVPPRGDGGPAEVAVGIPPKANTPSVEQLLAADIEPVAPIAPIEFGNLDGERVSDGSNPFDGVLRAMVRNGASDLHLTRGERVAMRIDGDMTRLGERTVSAEQLATWFEPIVPARNRAEFIERNDTDFAYAVCGLGRFRVNLFRDHNGVGAVLRLIPEEILPFEKLGLPEQVRDLCTLNKGLVVVTGPTGSGKSTTLAALIDEINETRDDHIITIEDPIEFVHPQKRCLLNQREVGKHTRSFGAALRAALREDPDVVLIGELRDEETISTAIETAETGHLVFGTLHTNTATSTIDRLVDSFPMERQSQIRAMLAESLRGVIAQTLVKKNGGGRAAAYEILVIDRAVSAMIREGKAQMIASRMQTHRQIGNRLLNQSLAELVAANVTTAEEALRRAVDKGGLKAMLGV